MEASGAQAPPPPPPPPPQFLHHHAALGRITTILKQVNRFFLANHTHFQNHNFVANLGASPITKYPNNHYFTIGVASLETYILTPLNLYEQMSRYSTYSRHPNGSLTLLAIPGYDMSSDCSTCVGAESIQCVEGQRNRTVV